MHNETLLSLYEIVMNLPIHDVLLLYFISFTLVLIVKNLFGIEISNKFEMGKSVSSGLIITYLFVAPPTAWVVNFLGGAESRVEYVAAVSGILSLFFIIIAIIVRSETARKAYYTFYALTMFLFERRKRFNTLLKRTNLDEIKIAAESRPVRYSEKYYQQHIFSHLNIFSIGSILFYNSFFENYIFMMLIWILILSMIVTSLRKEYQNATKENWFSRDYGNAGFGWGVKHIVKQSKKTRS